MKNFCHNVPCSRFIATAVVAIVEVAAAAVVGVDLSCCGISRRR